MVEGLRADQSGTRPFNERCPDSVGILSGNLVFEHGQEHFKAFDRLHFMGNATRHQHNFASVHNARLATDCDLGLTIQNLDEGIKWYRMFR